MASRKQRERRRLAKIEFMESIRKPKGEVLEEPEKEEKPKATKKSTTKKKSSSQGKKTSQKEK